MSTKVGLLTTRLSGTSMPSATARVRNVLPAPSGPTSATTAPRNSNSPRRRPSAVIAAGSDTSMVSESNIHENQRRTHRRGTKEQTNHRGTEDTETRITENDQRVKTTGF